LRRREKGSSGETEKITYLDIATPEVTTNIDVHREEGPVFVSGKVRGHIGIGSRGRKWSREGSTKGRKGAGGRRRIEEGFGGHEVLVSEWAREMDGVRVKGVWGGRKLCF